MREACTLYPLVDGKQSKLYMDLYTLTKQDRRLTNLLYALSRQDEIKKLFAHSDLNSQGEPNTDIFVKKLNVESLTKEKGRIVAEAKSLGALNNAGKPIYYDDMMTITQKVIDFNNTHDKMKAAIKYNANGFYIEVDTLNSENYNVNNVLNNRIQLYNDLMQHLDNSGLNTVLSDEAKKLFNPLNIYYGINILKELKKSTDNINTTAASLLVDLFKQDPLMARLIAQLGNDLPQAISQVSGYNYANAVSLTPHQEKQITSALNNIQTALKGILNSATLDQIIEGAKAAAPTSSTYMGTEGMSVRETLKELYTMYHLDVENLNVLSSKIRKVSDAANKLLQTQLAIINEKELKGISVRGKNKLVTRQKEIEQGEYIVSTLKMLENISNSLNNFERRLSKLEKQLEQHPDSLEVIRKMSHIILDQLDTVKAYSDITKTLANSDLIENDDFTGNTNLLEDIKDIASELSVSLDRMEQNARLKQVDVVSTFLKIYWGEKKEMPDGTVVTVSDVMNMATTDINIFDRFLYAANTTNDEMMNIIAEAVKQANYRRDNKLRKQLKEVRATTKELYDSGSDTTFMFEKDAEGYPKKIISDYDYERVEKELEDYRKQIEADPNIDKGDYADLMEKKRQKLMGRKIVYTYTNSQGNQAKLSLYVPIYDAPVKVKDRLTTAQYNYYKKVMAMKAEMLSQIDAASNNTLFDVIEIANDVTTALQETGGDPVKAYQVVKNKIVDTFYRREDDTGYGTILNENGIQAAHVNYRGEQINTLPLFYQHKIKDRSRVSTDFSKSLMAYLAMSQQYVQMNGILDSLLLAKDYMLTQRSVAPNSGSGTVADIQKLGKKAYVNVATKLGVETGLGGLAEDFFERVVYSKSRRDEGYLWGTKMKVDKTVDMLVGYTSVAGLAVNVLGAEVNLLIGKVQMLIESGLGMGGEFFNFKDLIYADTEYFHLLGGVLAEVGSNNKSSKLGLLMERFDVLGDFYEKIKETGFYNNPISKIIGNTNLFFLYGIGEHLLHAQGMLAVLHNRNNTVLNDKGEEVPLIEAFDVVKDSTGNGELIIKQGYTQKDGSAITDEFLDKIKGRVKYTNNSMHGAFDSFSKGMIHRYAVGRMIMNFRQWMPAHYQRRFRGLHYDSDLGEYREGYYVSTYKFLKDLVKDFRRAKFQIGTRWHELSDMERYNLKRAAAETVILALITAALAISPDYKDRKGNWAYRHLIYLLKRMQLEVAASDPANPYVFIKSAIKVLNSPMAMLKTIEDFSELIDVTDAAVTIEEGKHAGENKYVYKAKRRIPFYGQIVKMLELGESNDLFKLFDW